MSSGHAPDYLTNLLTPASVVASHSSLRPSSRETGRPENITEDQQQDALCGSTPRLEPAADVRLFLLKENVQNLSFYNQLLCNNHC